MAERLALEKSKWNEALNTGDRSGYRVLLQQLAKWETEGSEDLEKLEGLAIERQRQAVRAVDNFVKNCLTPIRVYAAYDKERTKMREEYDMETEGWARNLEEATLKRRRALENCVALVAENPGLSRAEKDAVEDAVKSYKSN
jgi:hypothetical protein